MKKYTIDYFIKFFSKIPRHKWRTGDVGHCGGARCALGHLGMTRLDEQQITPKIRALAEIISPMAAEHHNIMGAVWYVNDSCKGLGKHPRTRILNALRNAKKAAK